MRLSLCSALNCNVVLTRFLLKCWLQSQEIRYQMVLGRGCLSPQKRWQTPSECVDYPHLMDQKSSSSLRTSRAMGVQSGQLPSLVIHALSLSKTQGVRYGVRILYMRLLWHNWLHSSSTSVCQMVSLIIPLDLLTFPGQSVNHPASYNWCHLHEFRSISSLWGKWPWILKYWAPFYSQILVTFHHTLWISFHLAQFHITLSTSNFHQRIR